MESKLIRCIELAHLIQSGFRIKAQDLAYKYNVSKRTIFRDIHTLVGAGIPIYFDQEKGTYVVGGFRLRFSAFEEEELAVLVAAISTSEMISHPLTCGLLQSILAKILNQCPRFLQNRLSNVANSSRRKRTNRILAAIDPEVFASILQAIGRRQRIRIRLSNSSAEYKSIRTTVVPRHFVISHDKWYLVGRSTWHRRVLNFDLQDIEHTEIVVENPKKLDIVTC